MSPELIIDPEMKDSSLPTPENMMITKASEPKVPNSNPLSLGKNLLNIRNPSNGGIGKQLNKNRLRLTSAAKKKKS